MIDLDELTAPARILVLDPGGTTGWSLWWAEKRRPIERIAYGSIPDGVAGFAEWWEGDRKVLRNIDHVLCEAFEQDATTGYASIHEAMFTIGAAILGAHQIGADFWLQRRSQKALVTDADLKRLGLWVKDAGPVKGRHTNDTSLHALAMAKSQDHQPTLLAYWPPTLWTP